MQAYFERGRTAHQLIRLGAAVQQLEPSCYTPPSSLRPPPGSGALLLECIRPADSAWLPCSVDRLLLWSGSRCVLTTASAAARPQLRMSLIILIPKLLEMLRTVLEQCPSRLPSSFTSWVALPLNPPTFLLAFHLTPQQIFYRVLIVACVLIQHWRWPL